MARITEGNRLYFYQLFREEIGLGRQASMAQVEELLAREGVDSQDVECEDVTQLVEALGDIVKLTVFKKGRTYVTPQPNETYDAILERLSSQDAGEGKAQAAKQSAKPWKRRKGAKDPKPAKPRKRERKAEESPVPEEAETILDVPEAEPKTTEEQPLPGPEAASMEVVSAALPTAEPAPTTGASPSATPDVASEPQPEPRQEPQPEPHPEPKRESVPSPSSAPEPTASISLTITYDPAEDAPTTTPENEPAREPGQASSSESVPTTPFQAPTIARPTQPDFPQSVSEDVVCGNAQLRALYAILPVDADPMRVLDEDWRVARSTGTAKGNRGKVTFPLRHVHEDGSPVEVTLKRSARSAGGRRWTLAYVDGDDGTGDLHEGIGIEGLPTAEEGAWRELSGSHRIPDDVSPDRELAQFAVLGTWDSLLGTLATAAAPERWNHAHEGVGRASRYGILREYLCVTFHRILSEGKLAIARDGSLAAFDTGLLTPFSEPLYACFEPNRGDIAWKMAGFAVAGSGELGMRLAASFDPLPEPACYLTQLSDIVPEQGRMVILDTESLLSRQLGRLPRAFVAEQLEGNTNARELYARLIGSAGDQGLDSDGLAELSRAIKADPGLYRRMSHALEDAVHLALRRARMSYRSTVPVYDPTDDRTKLLVPLCLVEDTKADCAMVLALQPSGAYQGAAVLSLAHAYACARVVSSEQPSWLTPEVALS